MKESKDNIKDKIIRIYINSSKEYYYPGEKFEASILLDVFGRTKCDKLQVISKGKIIIKGIKTEISEVDDDEGINKKEIKPEKQEPGDKKKKKKKMKEVNLEDSSSDEDYIGLGEETKKIEETKEIFKYTKIIKISSDG